MEETRWKEKIKPLDENAMEEARAHWMRVGKPLFSLGSLEDAVIQIAGIKGTSDFELRKRGLIIMCADNGVVEEGVTQTGQEVTAIVADNFTRGETSVCIMAEEAKVDLFPVDVGMATDVPSVTKKEYKVMYGTHNFAKEAAMTREEAVEAIEVGIQMVKKCAEAGYEILATGEMGIGNTTTSSAVASVLLGEDPKVMTGKGAGLTKKGLQKKVQVIREAVERMQPDKTDAIDVLSKVGGLDIAGLAGVYLGGAIYRIPVLIDGFISAVAALVAVRLVPKCAGYILPSHLSDEPASRKILDALEKKPFLTCGMCLGEGTGAVAAMPLLEMGLQVYRKMGTFDDIHVEQYEVLDGKDER